MTTTTPAAATPPSTQMPTSSTGQDAMSQLSSNFDTFLQLLTTQLKNQDPTSPMDSNQFTQQLVEFSQVEQQINTNTNLKSLITQGTAQAGTFASAYLGKTVSVTNGNASLTNGAATWTYNLGTGSSTTTLNVSDSAGRTVFSQPGEIGAGTHSFTWNGKDANGNTLADGTYKLTAVANTSAGTAVTTTVASAGTVSQIDLTGTAPKLVVGNMELGLSDISGVSN
jgi:flagellar basal-body rod modification protein FlgD